MNTEVAAASAQREGSSSKSLRSIVISYLNYDQEYIFIE